MVPPPGITAGELPCRVHLLGPDLTTMVLCWAQMGYLLIQVDGRRILLHKRMEMGNERSLFEVRTFRTLFGDRRVIDAAGSQYAKVLRRTAAMLPGENAICATTEKKRKFYRYILCAVQVFLGICMAMNITEIAALEVVLSLAFGAIGVITAWQLQGMALCFGLRNQTGYVTAAVSFLADDRASFITGQVLTCDGGFIL